MGFIKIFLSVFSLAFRALESVGFLWDARLRLSEFIYGKHGVTVRGPTNRISKLSACVIAQYIKERKFTCEEVVQAFIDRIHQVNPLLNAVVGDRFEEALEEAKHIDKVLDSCDVSCSREKSELLRKPLLGVPITVKESLACKGFMHSAGLVDRKNLIAVEDASVVENLRNAGAIPIAVTNCSELCMWWETMNNVYGRTNNPYDTSRIAGGSSGGEGAIISAAGSVCGIGSDVGGSVRMPAFFNGIFGHKPSPSIVPNQGHFPQGTSEAFDEYLVMGPLCRYADDLIPMLKAMAGPRSYELHLDENVNLSSLKVYTMHDLEYPFLTSPVDPELLMAQKQVCSFLRERFGATVEDAHMTLFRYSPLIWSAMVLSAENNKITSQFLQSESEAVSMNPFVEIFKYFLGYSKYHYVTLAVAGIERLRDPLPNCLPDVSSNFVQMGIKLRGQIQALLGNNGILLYPSHPNTALSHHRPSLAPLNFSYTSIFNVLHLPVTQCPLGLDKNGLPLGIQIAAAKNNDRLSIAVARQLERQFGGWQEWYPGKISDKKKM